MAGPFLLWRRGERRCACTERHSPTANQSEIRKAHLALCRSHLSSVSRFFRHMCCGFTMRNNFERIIHISCPQTIVLGI